MCLFRASDYYFCVFIVLVTICIIAKWINLFQKQSPDIFCKKGVLRNFAKFTGKHLYQSLQPKACNFIKKETLAQMFSCEFCEIFKNTFFAKYLRTSASISLWSIKKHFLRANSKSRHRYHGIGIGISALALASASALKYKHCLLHNSNCL